MEDYSEYIIQGEPDKRERVRNWMTAIGLQDVDDLKPSQYFLDTVKQNIEGKITLEEVRKLVDQYYTTKEGLQQEKRTEEADKVAVRIAELIAHKTFSFRPNSLASIHRHLFEGIYKFAGIYRDYNITKPELVLRGDTVRYESGKCYNIYDLYPVYQYNNTLTVLLRTQRRNKINNLSYSPLFTFHLVSSFAFGRIQSYFLQPPVSCQSHIVTAKREKDGFVVFVPYLH